MKEEPKLRYQKNADPIHNRIIMPKPFIDKYGRSYFMEVYDDYIKLIPTKKER